MLSLALLLSPLQTHLQVPAGCSPKQEAHMPSAASLGSPQKILIEIHLDFYFKQH